MLFTVLYDQHHILYGFHDRLRCWSGEGGHYTDIHNRVQQEVRGMLKIATVTIAFNQERNDLVAEWTTDSVQWDQVEGFIAVSTPLTYSRMGTRMHWSQWRTKTISWRFHQFSHFDSLIMHEWDNSLKKRTAVSCQQGNWASINLILGLNCNCRKITKLAFQVPAHSLWQRADVQNFRSVNSNQT